MIDEIERPEIKLVRQAEDVAAFKKVVAEVEKFIKMQSLHGRKNSRLLVAAHTKMQYEKLMQRVKSEEQFIDQMEHHVSQPDGVASPLGSPLGSPHSVDPHRVERTFLTLLEELFSDLLNKSKTKRTKRFRRSGSLDGNTGERGPFYQKKNGSLRLILMPC